jgi:hypothetical protein
MRLQRDPPRLGVRTRPERSRTWARPLWLSGGLAAGSLVLTLLGGAHVAGAGPLPLITLPPLPLLSLVPTLPPVPLLSLVPTLPTLPLPTAPPLPSLPLPSVPVPSVPVPSIPVPSVPVPTPPVPSLPLPSLPAATNGPAPSGAAPSGSALGSPGLSVQPGSSALAGPSAAAGGAPGSVDDPTSGDQGGSPFSFALPLLIAGIPLVIILLIVIAQVAGGAVWLPVIRRWLNRRLTPDP